LLANIPFPLLPKRHPFVEKEQSRGSTVLLSSGDVLKYFIRWIRNICASNVIVRVIKYITITPLEIK